MNPSILFGVATRETEDREKEGAGRARILGKKHQAVLEPSSILRLSFP